MQLIKKIFTTHFISYRTLFRILALLLMVYIGYHFIPQTSHRGSLTMYLRSMEKGNSKSAIYWAKYVIYHAPKDDASYTDLANAYELDGQYEKAMESYADAQNHAKPFGYHDPRYEFPNIPRVEYKLNRKKEAFLGYCQHVSQDSKRYFEPYKKELWNERRRALSTIRNQIIWQKSHFATHLSPFLEYHDFLDFMEEEYAKLGKPPEYAVAMELFRAIDKENR